MIIWHKKVSSFFYPVFKMYKRKRIINFVKCFMNTFIIVFCLMGKQNKLPEVGNTLFYK